MVETVPVKAGASIALGDGGAGPLLAEDLIKAASEPDAPIRSRTVPCRRIIKAPKDDPDTMFSDPEAEAPDLALPEPAQPQEPVAATVNPEPQALTRPAPVRAVPDALTQYRQKKKRVTFRMDSGMIRMSVIDVIRSAYSLTLVLPLESDGVQFTPAIGQEFEFESDARVDRCSFPGFVTDIEELGLSFLTLVLTSVIGAGSGSAKT